MEFNFKIKPPTGMPDFIYLDLPPGKRQDGLQANKIPVGSLSKEQAEEYGEMMKQAFMAHWANGGVTKRYLGKNE